MKKIVSVALLLSITLSLFSAPVGSTDSIFNYRLFSDNQVVMDSLLSVFKDTRGNTYGDVNGMVVMQNGKMLGEAYYGLFSNQTPFPINSITKSIVSLACGICVEQGKFRTNDYIEQYLPQYDSIFKVDPRKQKIRISDLLNQTTGLAWQEWYPDYTYSYNALNVLKKSTKDWGKLALEQPMEADPGVRFNYNSAAVELLKDIMEKTCHTTLDSIVYKNLFIPAGIKVKTWDSYPGNGHPSWGGITLQVRDLAKLGQLMLEAESSTNNLIPKAWIDQILIPKVNAGNEVFYSYLFWQKEVNKRQVIFAAGLGDQYIYVIPSFNMVFAITSSNYYKSFPIPGPERLLSRLMGILEQNR